MEGLKWHCKWDILKYKTKEEFLDGNCYEEVPIDGNMLLTVGANTIWKILTGDKSITPFNNPNSYLAVGDSDVEADASQTGLQATTNKFYKRVEDFSPAISNNKIQFQATFDVDEANFTWKEFCIVNAPNENGIALNRKVKDAGTKAGEVWTLRAEISLN